MMSGDSCSNFLLLSLVGLKTNSEHALSSALNQTVSQLAMEWLSFHCFAVLSTSIGERRRHRRLGRTFRLRLNPSSALAIASPNEYAPCHGPSLADR